jgi:bacterioferritin-associated ferredoxin
VPNSGATEFDFGAFHECRKSRQAYLRKGSLTTTTVRLGRDVAGRRVLEERGTCQMFVCLCTGVTSQVVEDLVASGAGSTKEIAQACGAGMDCGRCRRTVRAIIAGSGLQ